jgi:hypothetical protein
MKPGAVVAHLGSKLIRVVLIFDHEKLDSGLSLCESHFSTKGGQTCFNAVCSAMRHQDRPAKTSRHWLTVDVTEDFVKAMTI